MAVSSSAAPQQPRPARRSIRFTFIATVALPVACLVALWALAVVFGTGLDDHLSKMTHAQVAEMILLGGGGLVVIIGAVVLMGTFTRQLSRDLADLAGTARRLADEQLPQAMQRLRDGQEAGLAEETPAWPRTRSVEIDQAATAISRLQRTTIAAATGESGLRSGLRQVFVSLARRNQSLLQRQLRLIDSLEQKASGPGRAGRPVRAGPSDHPDAAARGEPGHPVRRRPRPDLDRAGAGHRRDPRGDGRSRGLPAGERAHQGRGGGGRPGRRGHDPPAGRADRERDDVLPVRHPGRGPGRAGGQRVRHRDRRPRPGHRAGPAGRAQPAAGRSAGLRPGQRRPAGPVRRGQAGCPARRPGLAAPLALRRHHRDRADAEQHRVRHHPAAGHAGRGQKFAARPARRAGSGRGRHARRWPPGGPRRFPHRPGRPRHRPAHQPARRPVAAPSPASSADGTAPRLPQRTRQASLSPHLRDGAEQATAEPDAELSSDRSPEQARALAASLQTGWRRGRQGDAPNAAFPLSPRQDSTAANGEEA